MSPRLSGVSSEIDPQNLNVQNNLAQISLLLNATPDDARRMAAEEGIFGGISSGGALAIALRVAEETERAVIVFVVCDRGDRYLSTSVFS